MDSIALFSQIVNKTEYHVFVISPGHFISFKFEIVLKLVKQLFFT